MLLIVDTPTEPNSLEGFAARLGPMREMHFDRIHDVEVNPARYNVAHAALALPPHNDFAGMSWPPSVQALHMLANEVAGGLSVVVDGFAVLDSMRRDGPDLFELLCRVRVPFRMFDATTETYAVAPLVKLDIEGAMSRFRYSNQVMQPVDPTRRDAAAWYRAHHELSRLVADPSNQARRHRRAPSYEVLTG